MANHAPANDKKLFTPGPLNCKPSVRAAMDKDLGSRDVDFIDTVKFIRRRLVEIAGVSPDEFTAVPLQGSGTYAVEAVLQITVPRQGGKVLVLANGAYGKRMKKACDVAGMDAVILLGPEDKPTDLIQLEKTLQAGEQFSTVAIVHCETSSGVLNPVTDAGRLVKKYQPDAAFFVDMMSSFGAIPLDVKEAHVDYLVSSANKCLEGVPGFSYAIARIEHLISCRGNSRSLSLDLVEQYDNLEKTAQFRFTPPTHTMLAFRRALEEFEAEGGVAGRATRYKKNNAIVKAGLKQLGFRQLVDPQHDAYIITSFLFPNHNNFSFTDFYSRLSDMGQVIYPGKVTDADCFRVGNIGNLHPGDMEHLVTCIEKVLRDMNIPVPLS